MQEELEVRLEEIKAAPNWRQSDYEKSSAPQEQSKSLSPPQYPGHVKLELEGIALFMLLLLLLVTQILYWRLYYSKGSICI